MSEHLKGFTDVHWPIAGFLIFLTLFLILLGLSILPSQKKKYRRLSELPFDDTTEGLPK